MGLVGYENRFEANHPALVRHLQDVFSPVSVLQTWVVGRPVIGSIRSPGDLPVPQQPAWRSLQQSGDTSFYATVAPTTVAVVAPRSGTYHFRGVFGVGQNGAADAATVMTVKVGKASWKVTAGVAAQNTVWTASVGKSTGQAIVGVLGLSIDSPD
jgi:hypothetical protein